MLLKANLAATRLRTQCQNTRGDHSGFLLQRSLREKRDGVRHLSTLPTASCSSTGVTRMGTVTRTATRTATTTKVLQLAAAPPALMTMHRGMALTAAGQIISLNKPVSACLGFNSLLWSTQKQGSEAINQQAHHLHASPASNHLTPCIKENKVGIIAVSSMHQLSRAETWSLTSPASFYN